MASSSSDLVTDTSLLLKALRQELKEWETSFLAVNNRKAGREDIKQLPDIGMSCQLRSVRNWRLIRSRGEVQKV